MRNAGLEETQAGRNINIAGRNINNLRYADDTTLMAESEEAFWANCEKYQLYNLSSQQNKGEYDSQGS